MAKTCEEEIINTWHKNAKPWIKAVRNNEIDSRSLVTNKSILQCILKESPAYVLDVGCGEGWLVRALSFQGIKSVGVDIVPDLITSALDKNKGDYRVLSYNDISRGKIEKTFDIIVCNFSLFGDESVKQLLKKIPELLNKDGCFIVQTIHPTSLSTNTPNEEGWRKGSWSGFSHHFMDPAPWYYRTIDNWLSLFNECELSVTETIEPVNPITGEVASVIFKCRHTQT